MGKICYKLVHNRAKHLNADGKALLQIEACLDGKRLLFSTKVYLTPKQWNAKKKLVVRHPEADSLNYMIHELIMELERKEMEIWRQGQEVTLSNLKKAMKSGNGQSFILFVKETIETSSHKDSTRRNLATTLAWLSRFKPNLDFGGVNSALVYKFEEFLYRNGCCTNTVAKHMKHFKSFVNAAIGKGYLKVDEDAFWRYKIKVKESKHTHLLPAELQQLEALALPDNPSLRHTLDAFLFCCYTGMRYSDFVSLTEKNFTMKECHPWLTYRSVKTNIEVSFPLHLPFEGKAWDILCKYSHDRNAFFKLRSNTCVNHDLKKIGKLAGIDKHFTFHSARHTNATLLIYDGVSITTVQKLLGHRNVSTTQIYSDVMGETIVKDLAKCYNS